MREQREVCMEFGCLLPPNEGDEGQGWLGEVSVKRHNIHMVELLIYGRGSRMDAVVGRYANGQYICIPDLGTGCPLGSLADTFWNWERLSDHVGEVDAMTIANALKAVSGYLGDGWV